MANRLRKLPGCCYFHPAAYAAGSPNTESSTITNAETAPPGVNPSMWRSSLLHFWRRYRRRSTALLAIVAYLAGTIGFPLPAHSAKNQSPAAPCANRCAACGTSAGKGCCCCCLHTEDAAPPKKSSCCAHSTTPGEGEADAPQPPKAPSRSTWVLGMPSCGGYGSSDTWLSSGLDSLTPPRFTWNLCTSGQPCHRLADVAGNSVPSLLPDPPPRSIST